MLPSSIRDVAEVVIKRRTEKLEAQAGGLLLV
jgi:hypothetical protein